MPVASKDVVHGAIRTLVESERKTLLRKIMAKDWQVATAEKEK
jgi:hypothetical protein